MRMLATSCSTIQPQAFSTASPLRRPGQQLKPLHPTLVGRRSSPCHALLPAPFFAAAAAAVGRKNSHLEIGEEEEAAAWEEEVENVGRNGGGERSGETFLYSVAPYPLMLAAALPGAGTVRSIFGPFVELIKTWNLPDWLVHWSHPGNMAVVLFAMGGYGTYLGFRIRLSKDAEEKAMAKDLHPKLLGGMFFFFALGATGGVTALLTSGKPILESPHAVTGLIVLSLLTVQTILPSLFKKNPGLRTAHGLFGSSIMTLLLIHAALGLQLGLSF